MPTVNIGQVAATTWESVIGTKPTDNIFNSRALFYGLSKGGFKEETSGGRLFEMPIEYAENTNFRMYSEMEQLDTARMDTFDAARYEQRICAGTIVLSDLELIRNTPAGRKIDVLAEKLQNGKDSAISALNQQMWTGDGLGTNIDGVSKIISTTPTTGSVGGINRATFTFWRNQQTSGAKTTSAYDNLVSAMKSIYNACSLGGVEMTPTSVITDRTTFGAYEATLVDVLRIQRDAKATGGDIGFLNEAIQFKGAKLYYDEDAPSAEVRFLNPKVLKFMYLAGAWLKMQPAVNPANQLAEVHKCFTFGNMGTSASRHLGVVSAIS